MCVQSKEAMGKQGPFPSPYLFFPVRNMGKDIYHSFTSSFTSKYLVRQKSNEDREIISLGLRPLTEACRVTLLLVLEMVRCAWLLSLFCVFPSSPIFLD